MYEDERVRRLEEETEVLRGLLDSYDQMVLATGRHLADMGAIFAEYNGGEKDLRAAVSSSARLGASMQAAAQRGWRHNQLLKGNPVAGKKTTAEDIRKAFVGLDDPTARWVEEADDEKLKELVEQLTDQTALRAAVRALHADE